MPEARVIPLHRTARVHPRQPMAPAARPETPEPGWYRALAEGLDFARRRLSGDYHVDEFGFDADLTDHVLHPLLRPLYRVWFRVETIGIQHIPADGGALVVANHSGTLPLDCLMTALAIREQHPAGRHLRMLAPDVVFRTPLLASLARKSGQTMACLPDAERLLRAGELVGVWPEGLTGLGKRYPDRYKLQRFEGGGLIATALRTQTPIVPCSIVGAEEIYPMIGDLKPLARLLGLPYFPVTPLFPLLGPLGLIPLPSKWYIEFAPPLRTGQYDPARAEEPTLVFHLADQVREIIQQTLYRLLARRPHPFLS
jgi:1-acyl-sn-glycerol-3-phosphate acyltransferase